MGVAHYFFEKTISTYYFFLFPGIKGVNNLKPFKTSKK